MKIQYNRSIVIIIMSNNQHLKNLWCRDTYWKYITETLGYNPFKNVYGCQLRDCRYSAEECRGAHSNNQLRVLPHIHKLSIYNKNNIEWVKLYFEMKDILKKESHKMKLPEHREQIAKIDGLNFIETIRLWRELACYYRKIAKEIPKLDPGVDHPSGYQRVESLPGFYLSDSLEDTAWAFERLTRYCPTQMKFEENIKTGNKITIWDLCVATGINCKEGIHKKSESICIDDFMTGNCSCPKREDIGNKQTEIRNKLSELNTELKKLMEAEAEHDTQGWGKVRSKKKTPIADPKVELKKQIRDLQTELVQTYDCRPVHYSDGEFIPFEKQYENYLKAEEEKKIKEEANKASWDRKLDEKIVVSKPIIKLSKLGGKK